MQGLQVVDGTRHRLLGERPGADAHAEPVPARRMLLRLAELGAVTAGQTLRIVATARTWDEVPRALYALGPTFVKFGQIAASRTDVLPAGLCAALTRLHDEVEPMTAGDRAQALARAGARQPQIAAARVDAEPVGSGSIACVYRGVLPDGRTVALKLKRPGIDRRMECDLALMEAGARAGSRLPKLRGMPIADLVGYVSRAILGQLDFAREARHSTQMRASLADMDRVVVPDVLPELSTDGCLVFEFIEGLDSSTPASLPAEERERLASIAIAAVHKLFFEDGLVHCDLHSGNLYVTREGQVVILDAGYCVELPAAVRDLIGEFFARLAMGDGRRCGEIILASAVDPGPDVDRERFLDEVEHLVARAAGPANEFDMPSFGDAIYDLQQRHGIYAASDFAFPLMSLLVVEGTVRSLSREVDFQAVGGAGRG